MRVLIVDDEPLIAQMLLPWFEDVGADVQAVTDGFYRLIRSTWPWADYDALLCDLMLPGVTGIQIIETAKTGNPAIRTVALTAGHADSKLSRAAREVADELAYKPVNPQALVRLVCGD